MFFCVYVNLRSEKCKVYYICMKSIIGLSTFELEVTNSFSGQWATHIYLSTDDILQPTSFNLQFVNSRWKIFTHFLLTDNILKSKNYYCEFLLEDFYLWSKYHIIQGCSNMLKYILSQGFRCCWKNYDFKDILWIQVLNFNFLFDILTFLWIQVLNLNFLFSLIFFSYLKNW